ncbi:MAG: hypothetical protein HUJ68_11430 [Clostridia bacterium]|nr:hypothetical protein [Clostridia bacterium]
MKIFDLIFGISFLILTFFVVRTGIEWKQNMFGAKVLHIFLNVIWYIDIIISVLRIFLK